MLIKKKIIIPGLFLGALLATGATASAFYPGTLDLAAFADFSDTQKAAIEDAFEIRQTAEAEATAVLDAAGVDREAMHEAMHEYRDVQREAFDAALEANDYEAFAELVANTPMADDLTQEVFAKLVEAHTLREAGDDDGARAIMEALKTDLGVEGFPGFGPGGRGGHGGPHGDDHGPTDQ